MYDFQKNNSCVDFGVEKSQYLWHQWDGTPWQGGRFLLKIRWDLCLGSGPSYSAWIWIGFGEKGRWLVEFDSLLFSRFECALCNVQQVMSANYLEMPIRWRNLSDVIVSRVLNSFCLPRIDNDWSNISHVYLCTILSHGGTRASNWS